METPVSDEWAARIKKIMADVLDVGPAALSDEVALYSSVLQMDSMTLLHLLVTFEAEFDIEIDDEDVMQADLHTVGSLVGLVRHAATGAGR